jgi:hypothetical protein
LMFYGGVLARLDMRAQCCTVYRQRPGLGVGFP